MANNAYEVIATRYPSLIPELDRNLDVCSFLMSVFQQLPILMRQEHIDPRDLKVSLSMDDHNRLKVSFSVEKKKHKVFLGLDPQVLYKKNSVIVRVLEANPDIIKLVPHTIDMLTEWAHNKGLLYQDVRVSETILPRGHLAVVSLVRIREFADDILESESTLFLQEEGKKDTDEGRFARSITDQVKSMEDERGHGIGIVLTDK
jgi:hypothetical protein